MDLLNKQDRILQLSVVEDDPIILHDIIMMIESLGHSVHSQYQSGEALVNSGPPYTMDMLIVDIELEGSVNGIDAVSALLRNRTIPVIYLTSYSDNETFSRILRTNPYGYIIKPAERRQLQIAVDIARYKFSFDRRIYESEKRYHSIVETLPLMLARFEPGEGKITYSNGFFQSYFESEPKGELFYPVTGKKNFSNLDEVYKNLSLDTSTLISEVEIDFAGERLWFRILCQALFDDDAQLFEYQFIAENITERKQNEEELKTKTFQLNSRIRDLNCLYSISNILETQRSLDGMLQRIVDELTVALNDSDNISFCIEYGDRAFFSYNYFSSTPNYNNPIVVSNSVVGNIRLNITENKLLTSFVTEEEAELISAVSELISKTVVKLESESQLKKLEREIIMITEREKQNLGHELHDGIGQILTGTSFLMKSLENRIKNSGIEVPKEIAEVNELIRDATSRCRRISKGLVPVSYSDETFVYLVEQLLHSVKEYYQLDFRIDIPEDFSLKSNFVTSQLFRIVQESVNNVVKHACATSVNVSVDDTGNGVTLLVSDNGKGMQIGKSSHGLGMNIMKYRTDLIGADFEIFSAEDSGTAVCIHLPKNLVKYTSNPFSGS